MFTLFSLFHQPHHHNTNQFFFLFTSRVNEEKYRVGVLVVVEIEKDDVKRNSYN